MSLVRPTKNARREMLCIMRFRRCRAMSTSSEESMPPHPAEFLLNQPLKLYRDCLRLADYLAHKQSVPRFALREQVRHVWRKNQCLTRCRGDSKSTRSRAERSEQQHDALRDGEFRQPERESEKRFSRRRGRRRRRREEIGHIEDE